MKHNLTLKQIVRFWNFVNMNDIQFYHTFIAPLPEDAQLRFFQETPGFLSDIVNDCESIDLKTDMIYQKLLKQIGDLKHSV